jgi:hypothetical protein
VAITDGRHDGRELNMRQAGRIAEAFELRLERVLEDAEVVEDWREGEQALADYLQNRHAWDGSMAPFYLAWLRGRGDLPLG